jgi:uncharacterized protein YjiS (DUF1127 family)
MLTMSNDRLTVAPPDSRVAGTSYMKRQLRCSMLINTKQAVIETSYRDQRNRSGRVFQSVWKAKIEPFLVRYLEYRKKRRALAELRSLDPRTLKDMGINRSEVISIVYGDAKRTEASLHFWQKLA